MNKKIKNPNISLEPAFSAMAGTFHAYDVRGIYPSEVNERIAALVGKAFFNFIQRNSKKRRYSRKKIKVVVSRDGRKGSKKMKREIVSVLRDSGVAVINAGLTSTPMHNFIVVKEDADGGIMVTASHNPKKYNGFKMCGKKAVSIGERSGLMEIKEGVINILSKKNRASAKKSGTVVKKNYTSDYIEFLTANIRFVNPLKIVIDTGNGATGPIIRKLLKTPLFSQMEVYPIFLNVDGNFPSRDPNPKAENALDKLTAEVKKHKADLGIAFDGDGDRVAFVGSDGQRMRSSWITALFCRELLTQFPKQTMIYEPTVSRIVSETIIKEGGKAVISRVGHTFIKEAMKRHKALFGGESSGHYYFFASKKSFLNSGASIKKNGNAYFESGIFAALKIIETVSRKKKKLEDLVKPFQKYFYSSRINFQVYNKMKKIKEIADEYKLLCKISKLDGVSVSCDNFWFNLRPSNTEPVIRLNIEAKTEKILKKRKEEVIRKIVI